MSTTVAIVGAGLSGLVCASALQDSGVAVTVFEKSRGPSGRMSTRRTSDGDFFDHGAQYFTARDPLFQARVKSWVDTGCAAIWDARIVSLQNGRILEDRSDRTRYVGNPGMNAIGKHIAKRLSVQYGTTVSSIEASDNGWRVSNVSGTPLGDFDAVLVSAPSAQTAQLVIADDQLSTVSRDATMKGCWAVMVAFNSSLDQDFGGAFVQDSPLSWISCDSSKPSREQSRECWVLHASPDWTDLHLEDPPERVEAELLSAFRRAINVECLPPHSSITHRWRYAIPTQPISQRFMYSQRIGVCGDWCGGPRVEGAFLSGHALAKAVAEDL